jgi:tRNA nucleotidyltransferase (CCA-adding enzyme)
MKTTLREPTWDCWSAWTEMAHPSEALRALMASGHLGDYPELAGMVGVPQDPRFHPEGDVWDHTLYVVDNAAAICARDGITGTRRHALVLAALLHDTGKATTTEIRADGRITSMEHAAMSAVLAERFLARIGAPAEIVARVVPLVREHMNGTDRRMSDRGARRLAHRLEPADLLDLERLIEADASGRPPAPPARPGRHLVAAAERLARAPVAVTVAPLITGKDLIARGLTPGTGFGPILAAAAAAQQSGAIHDEADARRWLDAYLQREGIAGDNNGRRSPPAS